LAAEKLDSLVQTEQAKAAAVGYRGLTAYAVILDGKLDLLGLAVIKFDVYTGSPTMFTCIGQSFLDGPIKAAFNFGVQGKRLSGDCG
jgi:hypothetical protein